MAISDKKMSNKDEPKHDRKQSPISARKVKKLLVLSDYLSKQESKKTFKSVNKRFERSRLCLLGRLLLEIEWVGYLQSQKIFFAMFYHWIMSQQACQIAGFRPKITRFFIALPVLRL